MAIMINNIAGGDTATERKITYRDIHFDLIEDALPESTSLYSKVTQTDLRVDTDEGAILNSIKNIFTTTPGEKLLNPTFGINLTQWLFEPVSEMNSQEIGEAVVSGIERFEPRVVVNNITVVSDAARNQYRIAMALLIPTLNIKNKYQAVLGPGFDFITENE